MAMSRGGELNRFAVEGDEPPAEKLADICYRDREVEALKYFGGLAMQAMIMQEDWHTFGEPSLNERAAKIAKDSRIIAMQMIDFFDV